MNEPEAERTACTTCYMCACRCGIEVTLRRGADGRERVRHIQGNRAHPVNKGVICAKGSAGAMQHHSPARLRAPLRRVGPRGEGKFEEITWEEALSTVADRLRRIRETDPKRLAFFTGRDQSQGLTGFWAQQFGTPNYAAHGGFCSVNMAAAGLYTLGGAFWEFGSPDWKRARMVLLFGVAEDHDSNPIKLGIAEAKRRGAKIVGINPVRTGYNAVADEWVSITPGTDGLLVLALVHELLRAGRVDVAYLARWTNAGQLVNRDPASPDFGLILRDPRNVPLVWDRKQNRALPVDDPAAAPALKGEVVVDGVPAEPAFALMARKYLDAAHAPDAVAQRCGVRAEVIRRLAAELAAAAFDPAPAIEEPWVDWLGRRHERVEARPVAMHAMRGVSAHANGFQTARAIHLLQLLLGTVERPGGFRFKPPCPKPITAHPTPHGRDCAANAPLAGPNLGLPRGPEDLLVTPDGAPIRLDKAFSWDAPLAIHGMMHMVISNAVAGDPYEIDTLFLYMANMAWNSSMNAAETASMLATRGADGEYRIPFIVYADAYASETVAYADIVLPDTTYLERHDCISLLDRPISEPDHAADAIRWPVVQPDRPGHEGVRAFQSVIIDLAARLGLPGFTDGAGAPLYADYADYIVRHERRKGVGPLMGFRGDGTAVGRGAPNPGQLDAYVDAGGFFTAEVPEGARWMRHVNRAYQDWAVGMGFYDAPQPYLFNLYCEPLRRFQAAAEGRGALRPPEHLRARIAEAFDPLPVWIAPPAPEGFPLHAVTQRPAAMYHAWGSQNAWLRQIHAENALFVPAALCDAHGLADGDWAWLTSPTGRIKVPVRRMAAVNGATVWTWNAIGKRAGAWALEPAAPEATRGFLLNHLIHELMPPKGDGLRWSASDPVTGQAAWFDLRVAIEKADRPGLEPAIAPLASPVPAAPDALAWTAR